MKDRVPVSMQKISLIIPLRLTPGTHEGELRLRRLCATVPRDIFDILISDYGTEDADAGPIRTLQADGVEVVSHPSPGKLFSIGHARDFGVQMARQKVVLFNDIDFLGTPEMYRQIHAEAIRRDIAANMFDFFCVPVLFLTEAGTNAWFDAVEKKRAFVREFDVGWLERAESDIQFTAFGSSAMVVNRHHYLALGGHDPGFSGHGAEDYDLLHRLASLAPKGPRPNEYLTDFKDNGVRNYWGFRALFALYGLEVFASGVHLLHLWHPRRKEKGYFRSRRNFRHLRKIMLRFDRRGTMPGPLSDLRREERWLIFHRTAKDLSLIRQFLPFCRHYRLVQTRSLPAAYKLARLLDMADADLILIAPDVAGDAGDFAAEPSLAAISLLHIRPAASPESYRVVHMRAGTTEYDAAITPLVIRSVKGRALYRSWGRLIIEGLMAIDDGKIDQPQPLTSAIFASFGGETLLDRTLHPRPVRKQKSSLLVRLKRRLTGF
ncbi:MAG: capsule polysaccharide biosynthesis protein [Rhizobium sp.]|nr:capsule polysaccharide biosynthesis protein [Rhizobium sp.]